VPNSERFRPAADSALAELTEDPASRKQFLRMAGAGAAGSLVVLLAACGKDSDKAASAGKATATMDDSPAAAGGGANGDLSIVNYALTLEYIEADFYRQVIDSGEITDKKLVTLAKRIGQSEQEHVDALTAVANQLGKAVEAPTTTFDDVLAGGPTMILQTAATVENLGAAAYLGQAGAIKDKKLLASALAIHSVEARHAAALNALVGRGFKGSSALEGSVPDGAFAKPMTMDEVLAAAKPFLAS
jgi:rubrerythrin